MATLQTVGYTVVRRTTMEVKICINCKKLFQYISGPDLCSNCKELTSNVEVDSEDSRKNTKNLNPLVKEEEKKYEQVKEYVIQHPKATVTEISKENDIPVKKLFQWIRDERLAFSDNSRDAWYECERCGRKINSGRLCSNCK